MKKVQLALVAALVAGAASSSFAQGAQQQAGPPQGQRPNMMAMVMQGITLSADQQTKVDSIVKKYQAQREAARAEMQSADQDTRRAKMREMMTKQTDEIKAVLTDDQKKTFDKNLADAQARMQQGGGRPPQL